MTFSSAGSGLPNGHRSRTPGTSTATAPPTRRPPTRTHVYRTKGRFTARLTVTTPGKLSGLAATEITVGNTRPDGHDQQPPTAGSSSFGDRIPYTVTVTDPEDGRRSTAPGSSCRRCSATTRTLHPLDNYIGCSGEIRTDAGDGHGPGQNLYYGITAQYEDKGAPGAPALTGSTSLTLRPALREAEHHTSTGGAHGGVVVASRADASGGKRLTEIEDGDWIRFDPVHLKGIDSVTVGAASGGLGGTVEFRSGSPTGSLLGSVSVPNTGDWGNVVSPTTPLKFAGISAPLYAVFSNPQWTADKPDLFAVDWLHFNGRGVEKHPGTKVTVQAAPAAGTAPLAVQLTSTVKPLAGRTIASYHWDFGDNTKPTAPEGATATHSYTRPGTYTAHLTVTDNEGDTTSAFARVTVS